MSPGMLTTLTDPLTPRAACNETPARPPDPWRQWSNAAPRERQVLSVAELADCSCPELCNRDHANE
jgi:hypothetical protein